MAKVAEFIQNHTINEMGNDKKKYAKKYAKDTDKGKETYLAKDTGPRMNAKKVYAMKTKIKNDEELTGDEKKKLAKAVEKDDDSKTDKIMNKVRKGEDLSASEKKSLSYILDRQKDAANESTHSEDDLSEAKTIGDKELKDLSKQVGQLAKQIPTGESVNNRLAKADSQQAKNLQQKLAKAQKLVDEFEDAKKKIDPLKDSDVQGRKTLKKKFQRLYKEMNKYQGLEREAERILADVKGKKEAEQSHTKQKEKKKEFKQKVKKNLEQKRGERKKEFKNKMKKAVGQGDQ